MSDTRTGKTGAAPPAPSTGGAPRFRRWREANLVAVTAVSAYSAAICWQCQVVSYPLFAQVSANDFPMYHQRYSGSIMGVTIIPGFVSFLACAALAWTRPAGVSRRAGALVSACGVTALAATTGVAIPMHRRLAEIGQSAPTIDNLLSANLVRTIALSVATALLVRLTYAHTQTTQ